MTRPKTWAELNQRKVIQRTIEWDGEQVSATINLPLTKRPLNVAIDNTGLNVNLLLTLAHKLRVDDAQASAIVGTGADSFYTVTANEPGKAGEAYAIRHVLPKDPEGPTEIDVALEGNLITVTLAVKADNDDFIPDNDKNTAALIAAEVNSLDGFTAAADGNGSGTFEDETAPVPFTGGTVGIYAPLYDTEGDELSLAVNDDECKVFGPFKYFPRFLGGRLVLTSSDGSTPPDSEGITIVQVVEG